MKKIISAIILSLFILINSFAQPKTADKLDGNDWSMFTENQKSFIMVGYLIANDMFLIYTGINIPSEWNDQQKYFFKMDMLHQFGYNVPIEDMVSKINAYYDITSNIEVPIWMTILEVYEKEFWSITPVEPPPVDIPITPPTTPTKKPDL